jgi:hypothetical protein
MKPTFSWCDLQHHGAGQQMDLFATANESTEKLSSAPCPNSVSLKEWKHVELGETQRGFSHETIVKNPVVELAQLDLFIHTPLDQALSSLRRALLANAIDDAKHCYEMVQTFVTRSTLKDATVLVDADICMQLAQRESSSHPLDEWHWLNNNSPALSRFLGPNAKEFLQRQYHVLAANPALEEFDPSVPNAYAGQIWFELTEFSRARAVLERDPHALRCPHRLHLLARVCALSPADGAATETHSLQHWQTLCFDWPEDAEAAVSQSPRFEAIWAAFCDLDDVQAMAYFPGFACLHGLAWPQPDPQDMRPCVELIRVAQALREKVDSVPLRLSLQTIAPQLLQDWLKKRDTKLW